MAERTKPQKTSRKRTVSKTKAKASPKKVAKPPVVKPDIDFSARRQKSEIQRLRKIYKDLPESQKILVSKLLARAAYINSKLEATEAKIDEEGLIVDFKNGRQVMQRINPNLKVYTDLLKIYSTLMEQIEDMIRHDRDHAKKENRKAEDVDPLEAFINAR